ncbi:MAG: DUF5668 domain-containing protein [Firmicutes bacterium]|nr:DUF5668 domain-containing protein [Bacillota bacterium]
MEESRNRLLGFFLVIVGGVLILDYYHIINFNIWDFWPIILIYIGAKAERDYFSGHASGRNLLTGATFLTYGFYFMMSNFTSWGIQGKLWPLYILGPGIGFLQMAYYGHRPRKNFRTGLLLVGISALFLVENFINIQYDLILFVGLIFVGLFMLRKKEPVIPGEKSDDDERYE